MNWKIVGRFHLSTIVFRATKFEKLVFSYQPLSTHALIVLKIKNFNFFIPKSIFQLILLSNEIVVTRVKFFLRFAIIFQVAGNSIDTDVNRRRTADAPLA